MLVLLVGSLLARAQTHGNGKKPVPSLTPRLRESSDPPIAEFKSLKAEPPAPHTCCNIPITLIDRLTVGQ